MAKKDSQKDQTQEEATQDFLSRVVDLAKKTDDFTYVFKSEEGTESNFLVPHYHFRSGISVIDTIVGERGLASSKISEVYGPNKSGKSEFAQAVVEKFLYDHPTGIAQYFDQETAIDDKKYRQMPIFACGRLIVRKGKSMEKCFQSIEETTNLLIKDKITRPILYVFDSVASIETEEERKGVIGKSNYAPQARILSSALRRIRGILLNTNAHLLLVNQVREKPGEMFKTTDSACGQAIKFYADYRIKCANIGSFRFNKAEKVDAGPDGFKIQFTTIKNKRVTPVRKVEVPLLFHPMNGLRSGLSDVWSLWGEFKKWGLLRTAKSGGWYKLTTPSGVSEPMNRSGWIDLYKSVLQADLSIDKNSQIAEAITIFGEKILDSKITFGADDDEDEEVSDE